MKTAIKLPLNQDVELDSEGFSFGLAVFGNAIAASVHDASYNAQTAAMHLGFDIQREFELNSIEYNNEGFLMDCSDGALYDIKRAYHPDNSKRVILQCSRMCSTENSEPRRC